MLAHIRSFVSERRSEGGIGGIFCFPFLFAQSNFPLGGYFKCALWTREGHRCEWLLSKLKTDEAEGDREVCWTRRIRVAPFSPLSMPYSLLGILPSTGIHPSRYADSTDDCLNPTSLCHGSQSKYIVEFGKPRRIVEWIRIEHLMLSSIVKDT